MSAVHPDESKPTLPIRLVTSRVEEGRADAEIASLRQRVQQDGRGGSRMGARQSVVNFVTAVRALLEERKSTHVIRPDSRNMVKWDSFMVVMLLLIALMSPFEIGFLKSELKSTMGMMLFVFNRFVDLAFVVDMVLQFFLAYPEDIGSNRRTGRLVRDRSRIARHYLRGWFIIDLLSIIPFDMIAMAVSGDNNDKMHELKIVRIIRLLRLLKLLRVLRASRVWARLESRISTPYAVMNIMKFLVLMFVFSHWSACLWALLAQLQDPEATTWVTKWQLGRMADGTSAISEARFRDCEAKVPLSMLPGGAGMNVLVDAAGATLTRNGAYWTECMSRPFPALPKHVPTSPPPIARLTTQVISPMSCTLRVPIGL